MPYEGPVPAGASHPGPPLLVWSPRECNPTEIPWRPGILAYHLTQKVWVRLTAESIFGEHHPEDAVALTPEHLGDDTPEVLAKVANLERDMRRLRGER